MFDFEGRLVGMLKHFNQFLHVVLAIALVVASLMVMWEFSVAVVGALHRNDLAHGFLQALGTLFIVWTLSSLISAEIAYVQSGVFQLVVFIEVAIITLLRQLIVEPVQVATQAGGQISTSVVTQHVLVLGALLVVGIVHRLIARAPRAPTAADAEGGAPR